jgi:hypothetical protein
MKIWPNSGQVLSHTGFKNVQYTKNPTQKLQTFSEITRSIQINGFRLY